MALKTVDPRFSVYVGNLPNSVSLSDMEELLYELFLQAGPLVGVSVPTLDKERKNQHRGCAFVEFQHQVSVNYAIDLLNQISLYGFPMKVSYMTTGNNSGAKSVSQSPTTPRPSVPPFSGNNSPNFLSFSDSPFTDARQLISPPNSRPSSSNSGSYHTQPVSSNRDQHYNSRSGRDSTSHGSSYYPQWLQHDTIRQIHDWKEREQERSRQSSHHHHHHHHGHHSNGYPSSYR